MMSLWIAMACFALPAALHLALQPEQDKPLRGDPLIRRLFAFSLWAAVAAVMWQGMQSYPLWYLNRIHGSDAAGVLGAMRTIAQYVVIAAVAVATVVMTAVNKLWESEGHEPADRLLTLAFKATSLLLLTGCLIVALFRDQVAVLFDPAYRSGAQVIPLLLLAFLVAGNMAFLAVHFTLIEKTRFLFWPWATGLGCNVLFGLWLVRGVAGATGDVGWLMQVGVAVRPVFNCGAANGIGAAAWAGALSAVGALVVCVVLLRLERRPVDLGCYLLLASACVLAFHWTVMLLTIVVIWMVALATRLVFSAEEKAVLIQKISAARDWVAGRGT
jgi:O-antigen/teichoic acid export membrane protein